MKATITGVTIHSEGVQANEKLDTLATDRSRHSPVWIRLDDADLFPHGLRLGCWVYNGLLGDEMIKYQT